MFNREALLFDSLMKYSRIWEELFEGGKMRIVRRKLQTVWPSTPPHQSWKPRPSAERTGAPFKQTKLGAPGGDSRCRQREGDSIATGIAKERDAINPETLSHRTLTGTQTDRQPEPHTSWTQSASRRLTANSTNMASASYHISNLLEKMTSSDKDFR